MTGECTHSVMNKIDDDGVIFSSTEDDGDPYMELHFTDLTQITAITMSDEDGEDTIPFRLAHSQDQGNTWNNVKSANDDNVSIAYQITFIYCNLTPFLQPFP